MSEDSWAAATATILPYAAMAQSTAVCSCRLNPKRFVQQYIIYIYYIYYIYIYVTYIYYMLYILYNIYICFDGSNEKNDQEGFKTLEHLGTTEKLSAVTASNASILQSSGLPPLGKLCPGRWLQRPEAKQ
jgi:hypothetical protein